MTPAQNVDWWFWAILIVGLLACAGWLYLQVEYQRQHEYRRYGRCRFLGCNRSGVGGEFGGERYCVSHLEYMRYGLEEPL